MLSSFSSFLNLVTQKFSKLYLLKSANISSKFWVTLKKDRIAERIFTLSVPCFHKSAKVSVMNEPYKRQNNSDLLLIDLGAEINQLFVMLSQRERRGPCCSISCNSVLRKTNLKTNQKILWKSVQIQKMTNCSKLVTLEIKVFAWNKVRWLSTLYLYVQFFTLD